MRFDDGRGGAFCLSVALAFDDTTGVDVSVEAETLFFFEGGMTITDDKRVRSFVVSGQSLAVHTSVYVFRRELECDTRRMVGDIYESHTHLR